MAFIDRKLAQTGKAVTIVYLVFRSTRIVYLIKIVFGSECFGHRAKVEFVVSPRYLRRFRARCHASKMVEGSALPGGYGVCSVQATTKNCQARRPVRSEYIKCFAVEELRHIVLEVKR